MCPSAPNAEYRKNFRKFQPQSQDPPGPKWQDWLRLMWGVAEWGLRCRTGARTPPASGQKMFDARYCCAAEHGVGWQLRAALLAATVLVAAGSPAAAQDATWLASPGSGIYNTGANWDAGSVPTGTASFGASNTTSLSFASNATVAGWTFNSGAAAYTFSNGYPYTLNFTGAGIVVNGGNATITNNMQGVVQFFNASTAGSATISNSGNLNFFNTSTAGSAAITNHSTVAFADSSTAGSAAIANSSIVTFSNTSTAGNAITNNLGVLTFNDSSTAGNATIINGRTLYFENTSTAGNATITNNGSRLIFWNASTAGSATIINNTTLNFQNASTVGNATISNYGLLAFSNASFTGSAANNATAGNAAITNNAGGTVDFSGSTGPMGDHRLSAGSIAGAGSYLLGANELTVGGNDRSTEVSGVIAGTGGSLVKTGTGTMTLSGVNTYAGATTVDDGALVVNGSITASGVVAVDNGATLAGTGTVGNTTVNNGGTFAAGNGAAGSSLNVAGNLALQSGAIYMVQINPTTSSFANVTGTAALGGSAVKATFANGSYVAKRYTILSAGSVTGTFGSLADTNLPSSFHATPSYDATHAYLNLVLNFVPPPGSGLSRNQRNVGNAIINYFNATGGIPIVYSALTAAGLTQASGETAAESQQATFQAMSQFVGMLADPFGAGPEAGTPTQPAYAADSGPASPARDAYAMLAKAPLDKAPHAKTYDPHWSLWAAAFGGSQRSDGNIAPGSNSATSRLFGTAAGAEYWLSPQTLAGFALAGGGTGFAVDNGGTGRSDLFQAGAYLRHTNGPTYISAALAYGWQDVTTDRTVTIAGVDRLRAEYNANAWSGRVEGGYRFVAPWIGGITPYAAGQSTMLDLPAYAESVVSGSGTFALAYNAKSVTDTRTEFGLRTDKSFAIADGILTLRSRLAWAHDFSPDRSVAATFRALPGASFIADGASQAADSALVTASAETKWLNGWTAAATFEGEFSDVTRSYAGKGAVRYAW